MTFKIENFNITQFRVTDELGNSVIVNKNAELFMVLELLNDQALFNEIEG